MKKNELSNPDIINFTTADISNLISNVFVYQFHLLGEATFGFFMQIFLMKHATHVDTFAVYHSQLYFEQMPIIVYKLVLDKSGKSSITVPKLLDLIITNKYKPGNDNKIKMIRSQIKTDILKKYNDLLEHIRTFRTKLNAHIIAVPIKAKPQLKTDSNDLANDFAPMIQSLFKLYISVLDLYGFKHKLNQYINIDELIKKRLKLIK